MSDLAILIVSQRQEQKPLLRGHQTRSANRLTLRVEAW